MDVDRVRLSRADSRRTGPERAVQRRAAGTFEVTITSEGTRNTEGGTELGRSSIAKRFEGDIQGTGTGEMLTAVTSVQGSAGYVAIEQVSGTVHGREGEFLLQHSGLMDRGERQLTLSVIPDSGTDELKGIRGTMTISVVEEGPHRYELVYTLRGPG